LRDAYTAKKAQRQEAAYYHDDYINYTIKRYHPNTVLSFVSFHLPNDGELEGISSGFFLLVELQMAWAAGARLHFLEPVGTTAIRMIIATATTTSMIVLRRHRVCWMR
jgi:hypothetical protein